MKKLSATLATLAALGMLTLAPVFSPAQDAPAAVAPKPPAHPYVKRHLYEEDVDSRTDIAEAMKRAKKEHKRIILDFGGDWCGDCQVLDIYFHEPENQAILDKHFLVVHVFIGRMDKNLDLAAQYGVPVKQGVPALAVIDAKGKVLYSQSTGQFRDMRYMQAASVNEFLNRWKG